MNNKSKFRFAILLFGVLSAFISTSCSGDNNGSLPDDPSQGGGALPVKQVSLSRKTAYGNDWIIQKSVLLWTKVCLMQCGKCLSLYMKKV